MANELNMNIFSKRLKEARNDKNMTQKELSEKSGVSTVMISAYERNNINSGKNPALNNIYAIATVLGVSIDWLCGLSDNYSIENKANGEINTKNFLQSLYCIVKKCVVDEKVNYHTKGNDYTITVPQFCYAYDFITDCKTFNEALKLSVLTDEMKQTLLSGIIEKYLNKATNTDELFNLYDPFEDLPF